MRAIREGLPECPFFKLLSGWIDESSESMSARRDTVVIGTSAGGAQALRRLLAGLPPTFPATVLVVQHQGREGGRLDTALRDNSRLPVEFARDGQTPLHGRVYLAPPDRHLLLDDDRLVVGSGPRENRARPAIDPLLRTAAASRGARVVAIQLTGLLADGVAGLDIVRRCGGLVVVQDPEDAEFDAMPRNAIAAMAPDHVVTLDDMPALLVRLVDELAPSVDIPQDIVREARLSLPGPSRPKEVDRIGEPVALACPDCGGPLWQSGEGLTATYRCHVGHALSTRVLLDAQSEQIERSMWVAVRSLSEHAATLIRLADSSDDRHGNLGDSYRERAQEALEHSDQARRFLLSLHADLSSLEPDEGGATRDTVVEERIEESGAHGEVLHDGD